MTIITDSMIEKWKVEKQIGIIGLGDMGRLYARQLSEAGWKVCACDQESKFEALKEEFKDSRIRIFKNGQFVSRCSDYIVYSVEAENIDKIVAMYGPSTKIGAVVGGQTSCKAPEIEAFEKHLPEDVDIVSCHSLHGPKVNPVGQPLVLINHRTSRKDSFPLVQAALCCLESKVVYLSAEEHDRITADTQAVTHAAFLSMGMAWKANNQYPWKTARYTGGLENAKVNISLRIYANKWHVYAGLAITNPSAHKQILQYSSSVTELFKLMLEHDEHGLRKRLYAARDAVFGSLQPSHSLLLSDEIFGQFSLGKTPPGGSTPNSHLSILAIVDSWHQSGIVPYDHMICSTPVCSVLVVESSKPLPLACLCLVEGC
jgi:prephenate dehydrogenase (NADP+)